jgi:hypothetical protein
LGHSTAFTIHDHQRCETVHRALDPAHIELFAQSEFGRAEHDRKIFGPAAGHQCVNGDIAYVGDFSRWWNVADDVVRIPVSACEQPLHAFTGRRHDGKTVRPFLFEKELKLVDCCSHRSPPSARTARLRHVRRGSGPTAVSAR